MKRTGAVAILALWLAACGGSEGASPVHVGEAEAGQTIRLSVEQELVVTLPSNPTTGYCWSHQVSPAGVLREGASEYIPTQPLVPGSGGNDGFTFTGGSEGRATVRFEYLRPWETGVPPLRAVEYTVVVE